jgi:hypothetical protein
MGRITRAVVTVAVAAVVAAVPSVAYAATLPIVNWAGSVPDDLGRVQVSITAEAGVASIKAHIVSYVTQQEVAVVDTFALASGTAQDGIWATPDRLQLAELGTYRIDVEVTDNAGQQVTRQGAGELAYYAVTSFDEVTTDRSTVSYYHRDVTMSGRLRARLPATGELVVLSGFTVWVTATTGGLAETTTGADGRFAASVHLDNAGEVYAFYAYDNARIGYQGSQTDFIHITISPAPTRITVVLSSTKVKAGQSVTVSGRLTWLSRDGWQPLANQQVGVLFCFSQVYCNPVDYPFTDADGRYSVTTTPYSTGYFSVGATPNDPFQAWVTNQADIIVLQPAVISDFTAARDEAGHVVASGHINFPGSFTPGSIPVQLQFSRTGTEGWTTKATFDAGSWWDGTGYAFTATMDEPRSGYWRAFYAGTPDFFDSAVSAAIRVQ